MKDRRRDPSNTTPLQLSQAMLFYRNGPLG